MASPSARSPGGPRGVAAAFLLSLPIAFLALVPSGAVAAPCTNIIRAVSARVPVQPDARGAGPHAQRLGESVLGPLAHLVALALAYGAIARLALRRFG
jgi:ABC-2 type transport system permease protein